METKKLQILSIQSEHTAEQLLSKISAFTSEEFHNAIGNPELKYYGKITGSEFDIRNKIYGPWSNGTWIKGEINTQNNIVTIIIDMNIEDQMKIIKQMSYPYFTFLGLFIMIASMLMNEIMIIGLTIGICIAVFPFAKIMMIKQLLKSMQKEELKQFVSVIGT
ncbi:MAG: hypothetical protein IT235_08785 [Bacteroidia bacterium]|nr:hypothetical protein [Bacteroidia bacterium]